MRKGQKVKFLGCSDAQVKWGSNDSPKRLLVKGETYIVKDIEIHSFHTKVMLVGFKGKQFNSCCFE